jgi:hypothetical protein
MPEINIIVNDEEHRALSDEHKKMSIEWLRAKPDSVPPAFETWLAARLAAGAPTTATPRRDVEEMRSFTAIEKLITSLQPHGFGLAQLGKRGAGPSSSVSGLAQALARDLGLSTQRTKRIEELLEYYSKNAKELADAAHVGITNRAYGALHEAWRELAERTAKAVDHLGEDRALGRVEGAVAVLVAVNVMNRDSAREKAETFRLQMRDQHT